jgi:hypothetical protein
VQQKKVRESQIKKYSLPKMLRIFLNEMLALLKIFHNFFANAEHCKMKLLTFWRNYFLVLLPNEQMAVMLALSALYLASM